MQYDKGALEVFSNVHFMLWSQIKLTWYDFTDLHITGEFDNRPGIGRFLKNFLLRGYISYGRRPASYMITSAMPGRAPYGVVRD